jgi:hypothetical protein
MVENTCPRRIASVLPWRKKSGKHDGDDRRYKKKISI